MAGGENLHNIGSGQQLQPGQVRGRGTLGQGSPLPPVICALTSSQININPSFSLTHTYLRRCR